MREFTVFDGRKGRPRCMEQAMLDLQLQFHWIGLEIERRLPSWLRAFLVAK